MNQQWVTVYIRVHSSSSSCPQDEKSKTVDMRSLVKKKAWQKYLATYDLITSTMYSTAQLFEDVPDRHSDMIILHCGSWGSSPPVVHACFMSWDAVGHP